jgi:hypothetical protein
MLVQVALSKKYSMGLRQQAAGMIGKSQSGEDKVLELLKSKKVPTELIPQVVASVNQAWRGSVRSEAATYLPNATTAANKKAPTMEELSSLKGDATAGKQVYAKCLCGLSPGGK